MFTRDQLASGHNVRYFVFGWRKRKKGVKLQKSFVNVKSADRDTLLNRKVLQRNAGLREWCVRVRVKESSPQANVQIQAKQEKKKSAILQMCCHICWQKRWRRDATGRRTISPGSIILIHKLTTPPIQSNIQLVTDENTYVTVMVGLKWSDFIRPGALPKDSGHCGNQSIIIINTTVRIQSVSRSLHVRFCLKLFVIEFKQSHVASI